MNSIKNRFLDLYKLLRYHDYLYHVLNIPIISDSEYDFLFKKFYSLKKKYVYLENIVKNYDSKFPKVNYCKFNNHFTPMLSLENTFDINGYIKFHNNIENNFNHGNIKFFCELKFDGVALSLLYRKGILIRALTRGDGYSGEDVTKNAYVINNIPINLIGDKIPELMEVRGEVCMLKKDFQNLNTLSKRNSQKIFLNTRNAAAGSLRQKNILITKKRNLFFYCYGCNIISNIKIYSTHSDQLNMLRNFGFSISQYILLTSNINKILNFYYLIQKVRNFLSLHIDGIVVKVDSLAVQNKIGYTNKFPKWAIAIKFVSHSAKTKLLSVDFQIGRTGIITPVANLTPILLSGAIIQKASLYNKNTIEKLNLCINDTVVVHRIGDVIPKIKSIVIYDRLHNAKNINFPKYCPSCRSLLYNNENNTIIQCLAGVNCIDQRKKQIEHFFSKHGLYAKGFSIGIITHLMFHRYIRTPLDCLKLQFEELLKLKYFGKKSAYNVIDTLKQCKKTTLSRFIYALGISEIGVENANLISKYFGSLDKVINCTLHELQQIKNIGNICSNNFFNFMRDKNNIKYIMQLIKQGRIIFINKNKVFIPHQETIFLDKTIVLTGKFTICSRKSIINIILNLGGNIINHITKKTSILIVGNNPGNKVVYASTLNIRMILEDELINIFSRYNIKIK
ncbi:DNA ligase [Buchnera aphidicola (Takecallis arundicolens)]|uniref:NAD-dependent DNA ligase LigA n=1 Tax=Buchnera aphidicola TaxID=9 RepID=UPI003463A143